MMLLLWTLLLVSVRPSHGLTVPPQLTTTRRPPPRSTTTTLSSTGPDASELAQQKFDAARALSDFHDGSWRGTATSYVVTSDAAAGVRRCAPDAVAFDTEVVHELDAGGLVSRETSHWGDDATHERRARWSDAGTDVDAVDGSYSRDCAGGTLPSALTGGATSALGFGTEHCLAVADDERVRMFALYGKDDDRLARIVLCEEHRLRTGRETVDVDDDDGTVGFREDDVDDLVSRITGGVPNSSSSSSAANADSRMERLLRSMERQPSVTPQPQEPPSTTPKDDENVVVQRHPMTLFGLVSGVWLGDAVVRDHPHTTDVDTQGFGRGGGVASSSKKARRPRSSTPAPGAGLSDGFAAWDTGVQKVALTYRWDYEKTVRQRLDCGRSMGVGISPDLPVASMGTVLRNDMGLGGLGLGRPRPGKNNKATGLEERLSVIDYDYGAYVAFIAGSVMVKVPRSLSFSQRTGKTQPFHTEFSIFQKRTTMSPDSFSATTTTAEDDTTITPPELFLTRMTRLYGKNGKLSQGSSSFYTLERPITT